MKKVLFILLMAMVLSTGHAFINNNPTSKGTIRVVITHSSSQHNHFYQPIDCPEVIYNPTSNCIAIDFGTQQVSNYNITISSLYTDVDYYVTSSYTTIPLVVDGISDYTIIIETSDGDVFEGTLAASEYSTTVMY